MLRRNVPALPLLFTLATLTGCGNEPPGATAAAAPAIDPGLLHEVAVGQSEDTITLDGILEATQRATLTAETTGKVVRIHYDVDDYVPTGAVVMELAAIEQGARTARATAAVAEAEAALREAETNQRRATQLLAQNLLSQADHDRVKATSEAARARVEAARAAQVEAATQAAYTKVRAPYNGIVTARHIEVGETATPGRALISGLSLEKVRVVTQVPQQFVDAVREQKKLQLLLPGGSAVEAHNVVVFPYADEASHGFKVRADLSPNISGGIYPGMYVKVRLAVAMHPTIRIPRTALVERNELSAVYVHREGGRPELRQVRAGRRGEVVEIEAGLLSGERIWREAAQAAARATAAPR